MALDPVVLFEQLAELGSAPEEGCNLIGVGYDEALDRLERKYIQDRFNRGGSAEKFVIGPYGSGKTHFLRQVLERGRLQDCVTAEVALTKKIDFCDNLIVYREIVREIRAPGSDSKGIRAFINAGIDRVRSKAPSSESSEDLLNAWARALSEADFELQSFGRVLKTAVEAHVRDDDELLHAACKWLDGDFSEKAVCRRLGESSISTSEMALHAGRAQLSLFQFAKFVGFRGTVLAFDEAEQNFATDKKKAAKIFSHLLADINALSTLRKGSALVIYAITPDVLEKIGEQLPALKQRLGDPNAAVGFFEGSTVAPTIDLTRRLADPEKELMQIATRLVSVFFETVHDAPKGEEEIFRSTLPERVRLVAAEEASSSARRSIVKNVAEGLVTMRERALGLEPTVRSPHVEPEV